jgi:hypothetical protein
LNTVLDREVGLVESRPFWRRSARSRSPQVDLAFLAGSDHEVRQAARLVRQQDGGAGAEVLVRVVERLEVRRDEVVADAQAAVGGELDEGLVVVAVGWSCITVARLEVDVAVGVGGERSTAFPDGVQLAVGRGAEHAGLLKCLGVVADHPAVSFDVAVRGPAGVDDAVEQQQAGSFLVVLRAERDDGAAVAGARDGCSDLDRPTELLVSGGQVEGMQPLVIGGSGPDALLGHGYQVEGVGGRVDDRSAGDADLRGDLVAANIRGQDDVDVGAGVDEARVPDGVGGTQAVGVEGVDAIVLRGDEYEVMDALARNIDASHVQRLGIDLPVHRVGVQLAERGRGDVGRREGGLGQVLTRPRHVVVIRQDVGGRQPARFEHFQAQGETRNRPLPGPARVALPRVPTHVSICFPKGAGQESMQTGFQVG